MSGFYTVDGRFLATENGKPVVGAKLYVYQAGTTTPATSYKNTALTIPNTNPVIMDAQGRGVVILDPAMSYDFVLKRADESTISSQSGIVLPPSVAELAAVADSVADENAAMLAAVAAEHAAMLAGDAALLVAINLLQAQQHEITGSMNVVSGPTLGAAIFTGGTVSPATANYNASNGQFTVPVDGYWRLTGYISFQIVTGNGTSTAVIQIDGANFREVALLNNSGAATLTQRASFTVEFYATAGKVLRVIATQQGSSGATQCQGHWLHIRKVA